MKIRPAVIVVKDAKVLNLAAAGSELVGLIPLEAMLMAADYYIEKENLFILDENKPSIETPIMQLEQTTN